MYAPYGEQLLNQQSTTTYNERFTFTGKERDIETGYDYFGARNYLSALSIWGAIDPLADKYIYNSPYVYCDGNPIKYVDPDGMKLRYGSNVTNEFKQQFAETISFMNSKGTGSIISQIENNETIIYIVPTTGNSRFSPKKKTIFWNPKMGLITNLGVFLSPATVLNHEADHALREIVDPKQKDIDKNTKDENYGNAEEKRVITQSEQQTAQRHGEIGPNEVTREDHLGQPYETISPTSTIGISEPIIVPSSPKD